MREYAEKLILYPQKQIVVTLFRFTSNVRVQKLRSNAWIEDPGRFRELWETCSFHPATISPLNSLMAPSYDQKTEKLHE